MLFRTFLFKIGFLQTFNQFLFQDIIVFRNYYL